MFVPTEVAYKADEILMCTTAGGIMPITTLDPVADGKVGSVDEEDVGWVLGDAL
jgi:branched-subunit amino acid aminotransferase/4-amino-4-deoxychorismate lyase